MKRYVYIPLVTVLASCAVFQGGKKKAASKSTAAAPAAPQATKTGVKPYSAVVTSDLISQKGLITVHSTKEKDTVLFEISKDLLMRDLLAMAYMRKTTTDVDILPGEEIEDKLIYFEKTTNDRLLLRQHILAADGVPGEAIYSSVVSSNNDATLAILPILAYGKDSASYVVNFTPVLKDNNSFINNFDRKELTDKISLGGMTDQTVEEIHTFPDNILVAVSRNGSVRKKDVPEPMAFSMETGTSFLLLPEKPMGRRMSDKRVGYFNQTANLYYDSAHNVQTLGFIKRWRIEPKPEDIEKYKRGELVEPAKPIVIYIDPNTPKKYVPYLIQGVKDWIPAFEQAGFKNAITAKAWPVNDSAFDMNDARYSMLYYLPSQTFNAYGPAFTDPRSGEIIQTRIGWFSNISSLIAGWYQIQAAPNDPRARKFKLDDELMGRLVRTIAAHEVGHTLGLTHNFGSSSQTPVDSLRSKTFLEKYGHTASIMDYARFNYAAQPEDNIPPELLMPRVNDYDKWAIEWGYKYLGEKDPFADARIMDKIATKRLAENNRLFYGDGEDQDGVDMRNQTEDLSDNVAVADSLGLRNMRIVMKNLLEWTKDDESAEKNGYDLYDAMMLHYMRYMMHNLGGMFGVNTTLRKDGSEEPVYTVEPKSKQLASLHFLCRELFTDSDWMDDPAVMNHIFMPLTESYITDMQRKAICAVFDAGLIDRFISQEERFGADKVITAREYIDILHSYIWKNMESGPLTVDPELKNLQRSYVNSLLYVVVNKEQAYSSSPAIEVLSTELNKILVMIKSTLPKADQETKDHLLDLKERIYRLTRKS